MPKIDIFKYFITISRYNKTNTGSHPGENPLYNPYKGTWGKFAAFIWPLKSSAAPVPRAIKWLCPPWPRFFGQNDLPAQ